MINAMKNKILFFRQKYFFPEIATLVSDFPLLPLALVKTFYYERVQRQCWITDRQILTRFLVCRKIWSACFCTEDWLHRVTIVENEDVSKTCATTVGADILKC